MKNLSTFTSHNDIFDYEGQFMKVGNSPKLHFGPYLHSGAIFTGFQKTPKADYDLTIEVKTCDSHCLSGCMNAFCLFPESETMASNFDVEIVGLKGESFVTGKWGILFEVDQRHWMRFPEFSPFASSFDKPEFKYSLPKNPDFLFMRWKEFPFQSVDDSEVKNNNCLLGVYYMIFYPKSGRFHGFYYHKSNMPLIEVFLEYSPAFRHSATQSVR